VSTRDLHLRNLREVVEELEHAQHWLRRSARQCEQVDMTRDLTEEEYDALEAYTSRFSRLSDLLIQKVFRSIDTVELELAGTLLDAVNRAAKRGLVEDVDDIFRIRETRNEVAHEYIAEDLPALFDRIRKYAPVLDRVVDTTVAYCQKYLGDLPRKERD